MLIALSGKRQRGKTTAADYLVRHHKFVKVSFAEALKEDARNLFEFEDEHLYGALKDKKFKDYEWTPREFLIRYGQFLRYFDADYWVKNLLKLLDLDDPKRKYVCDDLRFVNEAQILKKAGAKLIRINRYDKDLDIKYDANIDNDISETALDDYKEWDAVIESFQNTTKPVLYKTLEGLVKVL